MAHVKLTPRQQLIVDELRSEPGLGIVNFELYVTAGVALAHRDVRVGNLETGQPFWRTELYRIYPDGRVELT